MKIDAEEKRHLREKFPEILVRLCLFDLATLLKYMKNEGWAYLDLNARNVLISQDGYFKLNNFGSSIILYQTE